VQSVRGAVQAEQPTLVTQYFLSQLLAFRAPELKHLMFNQITLQVNGEPVPARTDPGYRSARTAGFNPAWWQ